MSAIPAAIVVQNVSRSFGQVHAVKDASFTVAAGTVTALIGPNGSGKTTLLLMLASLLRPDSGSIRIAGSDPVADTAAVRSALGWMPDVLGSWAALTVRATLETTGRLYSMDRMTAAARASELIALVGLEQLANQPTRVLSRGQKQKLSLARALVHDPEVLLLDEPASGLDPGARIDLRTLVRRIAAEGKTVLVSSHVLAELDDMADDAVYLEGGVTVSADRIERTAQLALAGIADRDVVEDRGEILVPLDGEAAATELLSRLVSAGVPISAFAPAVGELEHTFLDLSRDGLSAGTSDSDTLSVGTTGQETAR
jgi:ABC-2 type transport system ATP-binding protein